MEEEKNIPEQKTNEETSEKGGEEESTTEA